LIFDTIDGKLFIVSVLVDAESPPRVNQKGGNTMDHLKQELLEQIEKLTPLQQKQVLDFALELPGELSKRYPGKNLLKLVGTISPEDLEIMKQAIEEGCEQIDESEW
jgi:hypothetical protein